MCIRSESSEWQYQDMPLEDFKKILPYLRDVETVVLEGWGESLLHKDLSECIRLVKKEGSQVGFVTSGMGLTKDRVSELIEAGLDFVGFSIAGTTPETHDAIRVNSHLPDVLDAIRLFQEEKKRRGLLRPKMHLIFLMVKDNIHEVPSVPSFAKEAGLEEVILTNICHTINLWQETQRVFVWENVMNQYEEIVRQAEANARKLNIRLKKPSLSAYRCARMCGEPAPATFTYPQKERSPPASISTLLCRRLLDASSVRRNTGRRRSASETSSKILSLRYGTAALIKSSETGSSKGKRNIRNLFFAVAKSEVEKPRGQCFSGTSGAVQNLS